MNPHVEDLESFFYMLTILIDFKTPVKIWVVFTSKFNFKSVSTQLASTFWIGRFILFRTQKRKPEKGKTSTVGTLVHIKLLLSHFNFFALQIRNDRYLN